MREIRTSGLKRGRLPAFWRKPLYSTQNSRFSLKKFEYPLSYKGRILNLTLKMGGDILLGLANENAGGFLGEGVSVHGVGPGAGPAAGGFEFAAAAFPLQAPGIA